MTKIHKSVLKSSLVMLVLFAVAGSGVAQAQLCVARANDPTTARAEGITETVGGIELRCRDVPGEDPFGFPDEVGTTTLSVQLNTNVTNDISEDDRIVANLTYMGAGGTSTPTLGGEGDYAGEDREVLSDDGTTITWKLSNTDLSFAASGETVTIAGIRANAFMVGDGGEITAVVRVNGEVVHSDSLKLADVKTGLEITVTAAVGVQCEDTDTETAMITIKEAIIAGISDNGQVDGEEVADDGLVVDFLNIPQGVTVTVPNMIPLPAVGDSPSPEMQEMVNITFALTLRRGRLVTGVSDNEDDDTKSDVRLSEDGSGSVRYNVTGMDDMLDGEWVILPVDFTWTVGSVIDMGEVDVSLHPVSTVGGAAVAMDEPTPRFAASDNPMTVISVTPCETTLLFPFVTNKAGFDTGIAISNTSPQAGLCSISYHGADAPDAWDSDEIAAEGHTTFLVSTTAPNFQGYIMADCGFQNAYGFGFITGTGPEPTLAQGYLAVVME